MHALPTLFLVGPTGAGKTTIGRMLAARLERPFIDIDEEIQARCGCDIAWIFDVEGEDGFRERETKVLGDVILTPQTVISTGAGIVLSPANRALLAPHRNQVIWLKVDLKTQLQRLKQDRTRPLLQVPGLEQRLTEMASVREPFYANVAGLHITTGKSGPQSIVNHILDALAETQSP